LKNSTASTLRHEWVKESKDYLNFKQESIMFGENERAVRVVTFRRLLVWLVIIFHALFVSACSARYVRPEVRTIAVSDFKCENEAVGRQAADILRLILIDKGYKVEPESYDLQDDVDAAYGNDPANMVVTGVITSFGCEADDRQVTQRTRLAGTQSSNIVSVRTIEKNKCEVGVKIRFVDAQSGKTVWSAEVQDKPQGSKDLTPYRVLRNILYRLGGHIPRGL
jgi:hypothetical protein